MESKVVKEEVINEKDDTCDVIKRDLSNCESIRINRRTFLKVAGMTAGALAMSNLGFLRSAFAQVPQVPLPGNKILQFVDPLPMLHTITAGAIRISLNMTEFQSPVMPTGFVPANGLPYTGTYVWGYKNAAGQALNENSHIGPVIVATRGTPTEMNYVNTLVNAAGSMVEAWKTSTDQTLHWANPDGGTMMDMTHYNGPIPAVTHLHGGEVPPELDGGPDAWFLSGSMPGYTQTGHAYYTRNLADPANTAVYNYPNTQQAANLWFHDHVLGITRLNVYAGLAGAYVLTDPPNDPVGLPGPIVPLVIQDRMFDVNGQLYFPNLGINPTIHPFWIPEFVGDTIVVNGKVWPYFEVKPQKYRVLFLNGSNARAYAMSLIDIVTGTRGPAMWVIGTDGGYLDKPALIDPNSMNKMIPKELVVMPGERYEVIIDFSAVPPGTNLVMRNTANTPFPGGGPAPNSTTGRIMQFRVVLNPVSPIVYDPGTFIPTQTAILRGGALAVPPVPTAPGPAIVRLVNNVTGTPAVTLQKIRQLTLNEVMGPGGPLEVLVNNTKWDGHSVATDKFPGGIRTDFTVGPDGLTYYSELPKEGETELWEIINMTADAHPIHLHLVQFQLMNRQPFDLRGYTAAYNAAFQGSTAAIDPMTGLPGFAPGIFIPAYGPPLNYTIPNLSGAVGGNPAITPFLAQKKGVPLSTPALPQEQGWKDTVIMYPGEVTRIMVRWTPSNLPANTPSIDPAAAFPFSPDGEHGYVWHCHIIDHEDNEMMRPTSVKLNPAAPVPGSRTLKKGTDY